MFYIVESDLQVESLKGYRDKPCFVHIIPSNFEYHSKLVSTTAVYVRPLDHHKGFIVPIDHEEGMNIDKNRVFDTLSAFKQLYTINKKQLLYHFNLQGAIDVSLLYSMTYYDKFDIPSYGNQIQFFYNRYENKNDLNKIIPLSLLYGYCEKVYEKIKDHCSIEVPEGFNFYNNDATNVFMLVEQSGLDVIYDAYKELFTPRNILLNTYNNTVFTNYNLYNATSRPTNAFNSVNFAAIPKSEKHRQSFRPQNDFFVEFDFDGYHLRLLCDQIGYDLTAESAHKQLARLYFEKEEITDDEYNEAKQINFHAIYGKIPEKWAFLEIFTKIDEFIKELWRRYQNDGKILAPISEKPFTDQLKDMNPQKLMNYVMQSLETSRNIQIMKNVLRYLKDKETKLSLYTYDSLLFDFSKNDSKETLDDLERIMSEDGKYPVKFKYSRNLVL